VIKIYKNGISLGKKAMREIEARLDRKEGLERWFIKIESKPQIG